MDKQKNKHLIVCFLEWGKRSELKGEIIKFVNSKKCHLQKWRKSWVDFWW